MGYKHHPGVEDEYTQKYAVLSVTFDGNVVGEHPYQKSKFYSSRSTSSIPDNRLDCYIGDVIEGGYVIDKRVESLQNIIRHIFGEPRLMTEIPKGKKEVVTFSPYRRRFVKVKKGEVLKSYDGVATDVLVDYWRKLGARIGQRKGDNIVWEDGEVQAIPTVAERWNQTK